MSNFVLVKGLLGHSASCLCLYPYVCLCSQRPLVVATGRTSKRRLATCCFTPMASPGAQCRSKRTGRGWYAVVHTAVSPVPRERLVLTLTPIVHFMEPDGRYSTQRAWMSQLGAIAGATEYTISGKRLVPKETAEAHF